MKITAIEGIGPRNAELLAEQGITTTEALLKAGGDPAGRRRLAEATVIAEKAILDWVNRADLMRVKGIGEEYSDLLEAAGVDTVVELARRNPQNLQAALETANQEKKLVRQTPSLAQVKGWVEHAQTLDRMVTY